LAKSNAFTAGTPASFAPSATMDVDLQATYVRLLEPYMRREHAAACRR
jgi:hypothetical protein